MTPGALLAVVALAWVVLGAALWRLSVSMDEVERLTSRLDAQHSTGLGQRRG
jgi:hypothetical protein